MLHKTLLFLAVFGVLQRLALVASQEQLCDGLGCCEACCKETITLAPEFRPFIEHCLVSCEQQDADFCDRFEGTEKQACLLGLSYSEPAVPTFEMILNGVSIDFCCPISGELLGGPDAASKCGSQPTSLCGDEGCCKECCEATGEQIKEIDSAAFTEVCIESCFEADVSRCEKLEVNSEKQAACLAGLSYGDSEDATFDLLLAQQANTLCCASSGKLLTDDVAELVCEPLVPSLCEDSSCCESCCAGTVESAGYPEAAFEICVEGCSFENKERCVQFTGDKREICLMGVSFVDPTIQTFEIDAEGFTELVCCQDPGRVLFGEEAKKVCETQSPTKSPAPNPTRDPTFEPTINPTRDPVFKPTINPTHAPTTLPTEEEDDIIDIGDEVNDEDVPQLDSLLMIAIIGGLGGFCCVAILFFIGASVRRKNKKKKESDGLVKVAHEMVLPVPDSRKGVQSLTLSKIGSPMNVREGYNGLMPNKGKPSSNPRMHNTELSMEF